MTVASTPGRRQYATVIYTKALCDAHFDWVCHGYSAYFHYAHMCAFVCTTTAYVFLATYRLLPG
jgi:hypothetical protein